MAGVGNFAADLAECAAARADADFLRVPAGPTHGYGAIDELAGRMAAALTAAGAAPGDRILVQVAKSPAAVACYLACLRGGFVHVPLNPAFTVDEVGQFAADAEPAALVVDPLFVTDIAALADVPTILTLAADGTGTLADAATAMEPAPIVDRADDDLAALLYTSGTTGRPKGAMLSHASLRHNARALHEAWRFGPDDVLVHVLPVFHVHGLFVALHCAMLSAVPIWFAPRFDAAATVEELTRSTVMMGVPTHYVRLLAEPALDVDRCAGMRLFTCGSAPLTAATFEAFAERTRHRICERYGMSEAGIITSNPYDGERRAGTVGMALPGVEVRVTADGGPAPPGTTGGVEVRGPSLFRGYWRRPEATAAAFDDEGWFTTGDVGHLEADGRLTLDGRAGDMIISGGENVYPKEIELVLDAVPGVAESAVIGVPHPDLGEAVLALLVAEPEAEIDLDAAASTLTGSLARFKHPKGVHVVDALPRNTMGKVQKHQLRRTWATEFTRPE